MDPKATKAYKWFKKRIQWEEIDKDKLRALLKMCVDEDVSTTGDITSRFCNIKNAGTAKIVARENTVLCGIPLLIYIIDAFNTKVEIESYYKDGEEIIEQTIIARLHGNKSDILLIERTILNFLQKLSGIATYTKLYSQIADEYDVCLLDTRKTTPNLRELEKYAFGCGGGYNHRMGLFDQILVKDNHLACRNVNCISDFIKFLSKFKDIQKKSIVEVEIDTIQYLEPAINAGIDAILLDNFSPFEIEKAVKINDNRLVLEASGGINLKSLEQFAKANPHFISTGSPIHSSRWIDIALDWE